MGEARSRAGRMMMTVCLVALATPARADATKGDGSVAAAAVRLDPAALERLARTLSGDSSFKVRTSAAVALGRLRDARAHSPLVSALQTDPHYAVRAASAIALGRLADSRAVPPLLDALHDADSLVRDQAREALAAYHRPEHLRAFERALEADDVRRRRVAIVAFGDVLRAGHEAAANVVLGSLGDDDEEVRELAERALNTLGHERAVPVLLRGLGYVSAPVRAASATLLSRRADERAVPALVEALRRTGEQEEVRGALREAVRAHREYLQVGALLARAGDAELGEAEARLDALRIAAALGGGSARRALAKALEDDSSVVRTTAARAALDLGAEQARPLLEAALRREREPRVKRQLELVLRLLR